MIGKKMSFATMLTLVILLSAIALVFVKSMRVQYLWYDEAGQFWISQGLNHYSDPNSPTRGLKDVVINNSEYNMDPGGFSILLHFWTKISKSVLWLRILPFTFYLATIVVLIRLGFLWSSDRNIALFLGFIGVLVPTVFIFASELRAYSMEALGVLLGILFLEILRERPATWCESLKWSIVLSVFCTSRYSLIVFYFFISIIFVYYVLAGRKESIKNKLINICLYFVPLTITIILIYSFSMSIQNKKMEPLAYLPYLKTDHGILLKKENILFLIFHGGLFALLAFRNKFAFVKKYQSLFVVTISVNIAFMVLSFLGMHPWSPMHSRCQVILLLTTLALGALFLEGVAFIYKFFVLKKIIILLISLLFLLVIFKMDHRHLYSQRQKLYARVDFDIINIYQYKKIYIDLLESPSTRYLFEYGKYKDKYDDIYPSKFVFQRGSMHGFNRRGIDELTSKDAIRMNKLLDFDLLITPYLYTLGDNDRWRPLPETKKSFIKRN